MTNITAVFCLVTEASDEFGIHLAIASTLIMVTHLLRATPSIRSVVVELVALP